MSFEPRRVNNSTTTFSKQQQNNCCIQNNIYMYLPASAYEKLNQSPNKGVAMNKGLAWERLVIEGNFTSWNRKVAVIHIKTIIIYLAVHWKEMNFHSQITEILQHPNPKVTNIFGLQPNTLAPMHRVILEKLKVTLSRSINTECFISVLTEVCHWILS
jgi:hypothetical protein